MGNRYLKGIFYQLYNTREIAFFIQEFAFSLNSHQHSTMDLANRIVATQDVRIPQDVRIFVREDPVDFFKKFLQNSL